MLSTFLCKYLWLSYGLIDVLDLIMHVREPNVNIITNNNIEQYKIYFNISESEISRSNKFNWLVYGCNLKRTLCNSFLCWKWNDSQIILRNSVIYSICVTAECEKQTECYKYQIKTFVTRLTMIDPEFDGIGSDSSWCWPRSDHFSIDSYSFK